VSNGSKTILLATSQSTSAKHLIWRALQDDIGIVVHSISKYANEYSTCHMHTAWRRYWSASW